MKPRLVAPTRVLAIALLALPYASADQSPQAPSAKTTADAVISLRDLELLARPLTQAELAVEADAWQALLKQKVQELSDVEIAAGKADPEEKARLLAHAVALRDQRNALAERMSVVLVALQQKGGKRDAYDA
jgi:small conductance mechanosensitive channel